MLDALRAGVILSSLLAFAALTVLVLRTLSFGRKPFYSRDAGSKVSGVVYAFGKGMLPWEKESARKHPLTYVAGVVYHAGIFAALVHLFCSVFFLTPPQSLLLVFRVALVAGGLCGLSLLMKRVFSRNLRGLSCPDDYASNAIVTLFVIVAAVRLWQPAFGTPGEWFFYIVSILMFLYVPVGKIRHCFFFFYSRVLLGIFFGRRAALPVKLAR